MNHRMTPILILSFSFSFCIQAFSETQDQPSRAENNVFFSSDNPKIQVNVDKKYRYIGKVPFQIEQIAAGYRYVFVNASPDKHIQGMFIIQQEGFLPSSDDTYKYPINNPAKLGNFEYQHSVLMFDIDQDIREDPGKESDVTKRFLVSKGYTLEPELVMSRYARPADPAHKHEIIFFCYENLSAFGKKLADFPEGSKSAEKEAIKQKVDKNCSTIFKVKDR
jgi:hypothetical protein